MTAAPRLVPQAGPAAWSGAALTPADWLVPIHPEATAELEAAAGQPGPPKLPELGPVLAQLAARLETGRGFAVLRGLTLDRLPPAAAEAALLALGAAFGRPLPQDAAGAVVGRIGGPVAEAPGPARFHADPADALLLLCLRQPPAGGTITLVSAPALHNALLKADRAALALLHGPLPHRGATPAEPLSLPVFATTTGAFVGRYDRDALVEAALEPAQRAALAALDAAAAAPGQGLSIPLRPGDLLVLNPHLVWKQVSAEAGAERELLRLWLATPDARAMPEGFRPGFAAPPMVGG